MAIYDFFLSRNNGPTVANYIGHAGRLFYDENEKVLRISDGATVGGFPITNTLVTTTEPTVVAQGQLWLNPTTYELWAYHNGNFIPTIDLATEDKIGGVKLGPGVITNSEGQIIIDSTGLDFSFGDFASFIDTYPAGHPKEGTDFAVLKTVNDDEDAVLASNGTGAIKVVGEFRIYPTNGTIAGSMLEAPVLSVSSDGDISARSLDIQETGDLGLMAALNVTLNEAGLTKTPAVVSGSIAQFTSRDDRTGLLVVDTYGVDTTRTLTGGEIVFRTGRGTNASTTSVQSGDRLGELTAAGWASNGYGGLGVGGLRILANENFTATARGSKLELYVVPNGTLTATTIATVDSTGIILGSGKVLTGNVSGNASTVTNGVYTTDTGTVTNTMLAGSIANNKLANSTISGVALGSNLAALTAGTYLTSSGTYTGATARTFAVDATTDATASKVVARDANAIVAGSNFQGAVRNAGSVGGTTVTLNFNSDHMVHCTFTDNFTVAFSNYTAGRTITLIATNTSGFDTDIITAGISAVNMQGDSTLTVTQQTTAIVTYYCIGTTVADVYASAVYA